MAATTARVRNSTSLEDLPRVLWDYIYYKTTKKINNVKYVTSCDKNIILITGLVNFS